MTSDLTPNSADTLSTAGEPVENQSTSLSPISPQQARVLGCLLEKEQTTPDYYPLTLNSLVTACNQSTNREPVVNYSEGEVTEAIEGLKNRLFVFQVTLAGARVQKYKHNLEHKFPWLEKPQLALLTTLLLRGPQTIGELRQRSERMQVFPDLNAVDECLQSMMTSENGAPLVVCFPPGPGRKSALYVHTLCGTPEAPTTSGTGPLVVSYAPPTPSIDDEWKARIEAEVAALKEEVASLKAQLGVS